MAAAVAEPSALILIVEDCGETREVYRACLEHEGYRARAVADGEQALASAFAEPPGLVIMDLSMPNLNGREATKRLKADPRTAAVPVVVLSGAAADEAESERRTLWDAYISKPCRPEELVACVKSILYAHATPTSSRAPLRR